ncbi:hypothetical protein [Hymenobacter negativus]|uniref:Uncharacterized protein n=1 Tax=Hymenobacter negativus TaxID=2795026 RepID=A0ABS3QHZ5_9BACT|nr:hypothetical protein [Hymenobacter negativus]MBO2010877.1 hypothetical protein [Hymenobacter negativus]
MLTSAKIAFAQAGPELLAATIEALRTHRQPPRGRPAYTTGKTAAALHFEADDDSLTLYGPAHLQTLLTGRGPTTAAGAGGEPKLSEILAQWAEDKGLQFDDPRMTFQQFGFLAARKMHEQGSALYRTGEPSGLLDKVLTEDYLDTLLARIAAGEMTAITTALTHVLQGK